MKRFLPVLVLLLAGCFVRAQDDVYGSDDSSYGSVSLETFGASLDPYGQWVVMPGYGRAWQPSPRYVGADFYPYGTGGRWLSTNAGWVFDSEYPFGWAVFHYGRWYRDVSYGWLWLPGQTWGPSWVSWRAGGPYIGWAPLGPRGAPGYDSWCFVPSQRFTSGYPRRYSLGDQEFHRAVAVTEPMQTRSRRGPPPSFVSSATRERIVPVPFQQVPSAGRTPARDRSRFTVPPSQSQEGRRGRYSTPTPPPPSGFDSRLRDRSNSLPAPQPPPSGFDSRFRDRAAPPPSGGFDSGRRAAPPPMMPQPGPTIPRPERMAPPAPIQSTPPSQTPTYRRSTNRNSPPAPAPAPRRR